MSLVTCAQVGEALEQWLNNANAAEKAQLCAALGCGPTDEEIAAVFLKCDSSVHLPGDRIPTCEEMGQAIEDALANLVFGSSNGTINATGGGTATNPYMLDVALSTSPGNRIEFREDGLGVFDTAPPNLAIQYVSSVSGFDGNPGTHDAPLRTITEALNRVAGRFGQYSILLKAGEVFPYNTGSNRVERLHISWYDDPVYGQGVAPCPGFYPAFSETLQRPRIVVGMEDHEGFTAVSRLEVGDLDMFGVIIEGPSQPSTLPGHTDIMIFASGTVFAQGVNFELNISQSILFRAGPMRLSNCLFNFLETGATLVDPVHGPQISGGNETAVMQGCGIFPDTPRRLGNLAQQVTPATIGLATDPTTKTIFGGNASWDIFA